MGGKLAILAVGPEVSGSGYLATMLTRRFLMTMTFLTVLPWRRVWTFSEARAC